MASSYMRRGIFSIDEPSPTKIVIWKLTLTTGNWKTVSHGVPANQLKKSNKSNLNPCNKWKFSTEYEKKF